MHISAITTVKHAELLPNDECVKIQAIMDPSKRF
jgi:hypothetical protein